MLLLRALRIRKKVCELKAVSRNFHPLNKNIHSSILHQKSFLKQTYWPCSRYDHLAPYRNVLSYYSTEYNDENETLNLNVEESTNISSPSYVRHPDSADWSEEEANEYRRNNNITVRGDNVPPPITQFRELCLAESLKVVLDKENYPEPTPIQAQGWPVAFGGRDMVGVSRTGSGKTLAYMLPAIAHAVNVKHQNQNPQDRYMPSPKVLVLGPTRELVQQILQVSKRFIQAGHLRGAPVYGGASRVPQLRQLQGAEICVATPGRLLDYLENRETSLKNCSYLVLDEADRMLDMGFEPQIRQIVDNIPERRQTLMWSATWPKEIRQLAEDFLTDYIHITVGDTELVANPNIQQHIYVMSEQEKFDKLFSLLTSVIERKQSKVLVFAETKRKVDYLSRSLRDNGLMAWGIHGDCTQNQRDRVLNNFRMNTPSVLIATDIASRGLDISDIHHVVNYDFPSNIEDYIHRIGRTARGSACGESHSFFTSENSNVLRDLISILKKANQEIDPDLYSLEESKMDMYNKSKKRYNYGKSYGMYKPTYGKSRPYGKDRKTYGKYGSDHRTYGIV